MIEEIHKIGEINSVNDLFEFKLTIKTIILLMFLGGVCFVIFVIFMLGGVNNTIDYLTTIIDSSKNAIAERKKKKNDSDTNKKEE
jgi:hypothetical protein